MDLSTFTENEMTTIPQLEFNLDWQHFCIFVIHEAQEFGSTIQENKNTTHTITFFHTFFITKQLQLKIEIL